MNVREELLLRCAQRRSAELGLSPKAYDELMLELRQRPHDFIQTDSERAYEAFAEAYEAFEQQSERDDYLDDEDFFMAREQRRLNFAEQLEQVLSLDPELLDVRLCLAFLQNEDPEKLYDTLEKLNQQVQAETALKTLCVTTGSTERNTVRLCWEHAESRPLFRLIDALARICVATTRFRRAEHYTSLLLSADSADNVGARYTRALVFARLENEEALNELDRSFGRRGNAWQRIAHTLLLYKLDRMEAAHRALMGFVSLNEGAAHGLLNPVYVDSYMPDRPEFEPGSYEEALLCLHETYPIISDTPDFYAWASQDKEVQRLAYEFEQSTGYDD